MCGILGFQSDGKKRNRAEWRAVEAIFRSLFALNETRGGHGCGLLVSRAKKPTVVRHAVRADEFMTEAIDQMRCDDGVLSMVGHTRYATGSKRGSKQCHPFKDGHLRGFHNGVIGNDSDFGKFDVDSKAIWKAMREHGFDGIEKLNGWAALVWRDETDKRAMYLFRDGAPLAFSKQNGILWFSSDPKHLQLALGLKEEPKQLLEGYVYRAENATMTKVSDMIVMGARQTYQTSYVYGEKYTWKGREDYSALEGDVVVADDPGLATLETCEFCGDPTDRADMELAEFSGTGYFVCESCFAEAEDGLWEVNGKAIDFI